MNIDIWKNSQKRFAEANPWTKEDEARIAEKRAAEQVLYAAQVDADPEEEEDEEES